MKWLLILWMLANALVLAAAARSMFGGSAETRTGGSVIGVFGAASSATWLVVLVVWLVAR